VRGAFELIVSSGEGETFAFRSATLGARRPTGREASLATTLDLDSLALNPGDILHLRAVARDRNDVSGPGVGVSETRTLRIARAGEYDSVAVEAAAPPEEQSVISQRMLIMLAEALEKKRRSISRAQRREESRAISRDQKKLRRAVSAVIFSRLGEPTGEETTEDEEAPGAATPDDVLRRAEEATNRAASEGALDFEGGESPVLAVNRPLLEAYRAMWDASMELDQGEPGRALPPMRRALAAIQRARQAERVYLRGRPPAVVVDLGKVRLTGKDQGDPAGRRPRVADEARQRLETRFVRALALVRDSSAAAVDTLMLLRIDALDGAPRFAAVVSELTDALRRGRGDAVPAIVARARRELAGAPVVRDSLGTWGGEIAP
jgi:hypothetical protein